MTVELNHLSRLKRFFLKPRPQCGKKSHLVLVLWSSIFCDSHTVKSQFTGKSKKRRKLAQRVEKIWSGTEASHSLLWKSWSDLLKSSGRRSSTDSHRSVVSHGPVNKKMRTDRAKQLVRRFSLINAFEYDTQKKPPRRAAFLFEHRREITDVAH